MLMLPGLRHANTAATAMNNRIRRKMKTLRTVANAGLPGCEGLIVNDRNAELTAERPGSSCPGMGGADENSVLDGQVAALIDALAQIFARLEMGHVLTGQRHGFARLWVAAHSWRSIMQ